MAYQQISKTGNISGLNNKPIFISGWGISLIRPLVFAVEAYSHPSWELWVTSQVLPWYSLPSSTSTYTYHENDKVPTPPWLEEFQETKLQTAWGPRGRLKKQVWRMVAIFPEDISMDTYTVSFQRCQEGFSCPKFTYSLALDSARPWFYFYLKENFSIYRRPPSFKRPSAF